MFRIIIKSANLHVLNNKICCAEVNKSFHLLSICEVQPLQHVSEFLLAVVLVQNISVHPDDLVALLELIFAILTYHVFLEFSELTR